MLLLALLLHPPPARLGGRVTHHDVAAAAVLQLQLLLVRGAAVADVLPRGSQARPGAQVPGVRRDAVVPGRGGQALAASSRNPDGAGTAGAPASRTVVVAQQQVPGGGAAVRPSPSGAATGQDATILGLEKVKKYSYLSLKIVKKSVYKKPSRLFFKVMIWQYLQLCTTSLRRQISA